MCPPWVAFRERRLAAGDRDGSRAAPGSWLPVLRPARLTSARRSGGTRPRAARGRPDRPASARTRSPRGWGSPRPGGTPNSRGRRAREARRARVSRAAGTTSVHHARSMPFRISGIPLILGACLLWQDPSGTRRGARHVAFQQGSLVYQRFQVRTYRTRASPVSEIPPALPGTPHQRNGIAPRREPRPARGASPGAATSA